MNAFIVYPTYREENGVVQVHLFGRLENGESFLAKFPCVPYFWIRTQDRKKAEKLAKAQYEDSDWKDFSGDLMTKVIVRHPKDVPGYRKQFEDASIACYEADIRFSTRFLIDKGILSALHIEGRFVKGDRVNRVYDNPQITSSDAAQKLKIVSIDIETDAKATEVYAISVYCDDLKHVFLKHENTFRHASSFKTEKEVLQAFRDAIIQLDPDVIVGWNLVDFDIKVLRERFHAHKLAFDIGRTEDQVTLRITNDFFTQSTADVPGRMVLDGINLLKMGYVKLEDYKLETAAQTILKRGKLIVAEDRFEEIERTYREDTQKLVDYNLLDSQLVIEILEKTGSLDLAIERSMLTGMVLDRVRASIASLDSLYLRELQKLKRIAPSAAQNAEREERTVGGYVMEGKPGIYAFIVVLDFKSLYPSIMRTFNIDPLAFKGMDVKGDFIRLVNGACFSREDGILPRIIQRLWDARDRAKKRKDAAASQAIKITMNSMYGVLANPVCRFYNPDIANAITKTGQHFIKLVGEEIQKQGHVLIYTDTDSAFVDVKAKSMKEAEAAGKAIQEHINTHLLSLIKKEYRRESYLELQFEKVFVGFLMPRVRSGIGGAKKRYAGLLVEDGKERVDFTGMEFVRSDWTELAKQFQMEVFDRVFHQREVADYVKKYVQDLRAGKKDDLLVYSKSIRKELEEYTKTTPPHVKAARLLGPKFSGSVVRYVWTTVGPEPVEKQQHALDYDHYVEKQLRPIADTVLGFFDVSLDDLLTSSKQKTLFGF